MLCLDGLRGGLAFYVMLSHSLPFAPMPDWLHWLFQHGGAGVDVFFILSGLVIVQSLESFGYRALPFLIARVARIYPVFLVVFVSPWRCSRWRPASSTWPGSAPTARRASSGRAAGRSDWGIGIVTHLTMTHGLFPNGVLPDVWVGFLGAAWSLSTEWQFYLLALLIGAAPRAAREWPGCSWRCPPRRVAWQAAAPEAWQFSRAFLPNKAQYFALGDRQRDRGPRGWAALRRVPGRARATLALCVAQGGIDKLLPPVVWTACLAAQLWCHPRGRGIRHWVRFRG